MSRSIVFSPHQWMGSDERAHGFTLLELLISITILGVIITLIFGGLKIGVDAWEKGERDIDQSQRLRVLVELISSQIASLYTRDKITLPEQKPFLIRGDEKSLEFASLIPLLYESEGRPVYVRYEVVRDEESDMERLLLFQDDLRFLGPEHEPEGEKGTDNPVILLLRAEEILFTFLHHEPGEEEPRWIRQWGEKKREQLPIAVKVHMHCERDMNLSFLARPRCAVNSQ